MLSTFEKPILYALRAAAAWSTFIIALRVSFENQGLFGAYGLGFIAVAGMMIFLIWNGLIFTSSRGIRSLGATGAFVIALVIIASIIYSILDGDGLGFIDDSGWNFLQFSSSLLVGLIGGAYLVSEKGSRITFMERGALSAGIALFMIVETISPYKEIDAFEIWNVKGFISIFVVTIGGLGVLYFSHHVHTIAAPLVLSMAATVYEISLVKEYIFGDSPKYDGYNDYSYSATPELTAATLLRLAVAGSLFTYCLYIAWRTRRSDNELVEA